MIGYRVIWFYFHWYCAVYDVYHMQVHNDLKFVFCVGHATRFSLSSSCRMAHRRWTHAVKIIISHCLDNFSDVCLRWLYCQSLHIVAGKARFQFPLQLYPAFGYSMYCRSYSFVGTLNIGIDANIEVIVVPLKTWEAHHSPRANETTMTEIEVSISILSWSN